MTDKPTVNITVSESPANAQAKPVIVVELDKEGKPKRHFVSIGERVHQITTYGGADWLLNSAIGVTFTFLVTRTKFGQRFFSEPAEWVFGKLFSPFIKNEEILKKSVNGGKDFLSIMLGGTLVNPIITQLEQHDTKKNMSRTLDNIVYGKDKVDNDPKFRQAYAEIDSEPVKDTRGVWISRAIAIAPLWAATFSPRMMKFMQSNEVPLLKYLNFDHISGLSQNIAKTIGLKPGKWMQETMLNKTTGESVSNWKALHGYIGFDYGLTIFYAILHAVSFNLVAKRLQTSRDAKADAHGNKPHTSTSTMLPDGTEVIFKQEGVEKPAERPTLQVSTISRDNTLATAPQLSHSA